MARALVTRRRRDDSYFGAATLGLADQMRRDIPGQWTDNRYEQANHYRGVIYVAIRAVMDALYSSTVQLNRKHRKYHATSLRRLEKAHIQSTRALEEKALPNPHGSEDEQFRPFDDPGHSLVKLIDQPNRTETFNEILAQLVLQFCLTGSGMLWGNPNDLGVPAELYVLPTALCYAQPPDPHHPEGWWRVTAYYPTGGYGILPSPLAGGGAPVDARDIFVFKNPHPIWRWDAMSPLTAGAIQLDILESIDQARWTAMECGLTPDMVLLAPGVQQSQLDVYLERLKQTNIGRRNFRKVMAIGGDQGDSKYDVKFPSTAPKDMDFSGGWDQMTAYALALFGVPKSVAGLATTGSYAELYAAIKQFHTLTLRPLVSRMGVWLTRHLARIWGTDFSIQLDLPTIDDQQLQETQLQTDLAHDGLTYNEYRAVRGRKPVPGGEVLVSVYVQQQQAKAQQALQAAQAAAQPQQQQQQQQPADPNAQQQGQDQQQIGQLQQQAPDQQQGQAAPDQQQAGGDPLSQVLGTPEAGGDDTHLQGAVADSALSSLGVHPQSSGKGGGEFSSVTKAVSRTGKPKRTKPDEIGVAGAPVATNTGGSPGKRAPTPSASDSLTKEHLDDHDPGEQYPSNKGQLRQQTSDDTSAPAAKPQPAAPLAVTKPQPRSKKSVPVVPQLPTARAIAQPVLPRAVPVSAPPTPAPLGTHDVIQKIVNSPEASKMAGGQKINLHAKLAKMPEEDLWKVASQMGLVPKDAKPPSADPGAPLDTPALIQKIAGQKDAISSGLSAGILERMHPDAVWQMGEQMGLVPKGTKPGAAAPSQAAAAPGANTPGKPLSSVAPSAIPTIQPIADHATLKTTIDAGHVPEASQFQPAAKAIASVVAAHPQAQAVLTNVSQWAGNLAEQHADAVANHFGIDRTRAVNVLTHAIQAIATHAANDAAGKGVDPAATTATLTHTPTGQTATLRVNPKIGAARKIVSDMLEHLRGGHELSPAHASETVQALEHMPQSEILAASNHLKHNETVAEVRASRRAMAFAKKALAASAAGAVGAGTAMDVSAQTAPSLSTESPTPAMVAPAPVQPRPGAETLSPGSAGVPPEILNQIASSEGNQQVPPSATNWKPGDKLRPHFAATPGLSPEDAWLEQQSQEHAEDHYSTLKKAYLAENATPDPSGKGHKSIVVNTDEWRSLFPGYNGTNAHAVHEAAGTANKKLLDEALESQKGKGNRQLLTLAGGGGSGKGTLSRKFFDQADFPLVLDQVSADLPKLEKRLGDAKAKGFTPTYAFVDRLPEQAFGEGVVPRALQLHKSGQLPRTVPMERALADNIAARKTALALLEKRSDIPPHIIYMDESGHARMITDRTKAIEFLKSRIAEAEKQLDSGARDRLIQSVRNSHASREMPENVASALIGRDKLNPVAYNTGGEVNSDERSGLSGQQPLAANDARQPESATTADAGRVPLRSTEGNPEQRQAAQPEAKASAGGTATKDGALGQITGRDPNAVPGQPPPKDKPVTLVFGGSFAPFHSGHLTAALQDARKHLEDQGYKVGKVLIAPSADRLLKDKLGADMMPLRDRTELIKRAIKDVPNVEVTSGPGDEAENFTGKLKRTQLADWAAKNNPNTTVVNVTGEDAVPPGAPGHYPSIFAGGAGSSHDGYYYLGMPREENASGQNSVRAASSGAIRKLVKAGKPLPEGWMHPDAEKYYRDFLRKKGKAGGLVPDQHAAATDMVDRLKQQREDFLRIGKPTAAIDKEIALWSAAIGQPIHRQQPAPEEYHKPNVEETGLHGVTKAARVGLPGDQVNGKVPALPNLTSRERRVETSFRNAYHADPDGVADKYLKQVVPLMTKPGNPPTFGTDDAKMLSRAWNNEKIPLHERSMNRATLNLALHQTANAIAKRAFIKHLDTLKSGDKVLVTVGGVGAGKGSLLHRVPRAKQILSESKAVWDSAGDQNATENPWIQRELEKRGLKGVYAYADADPRQKWAGVMNRAKVPEDGRMVDAQVFADSYALGAKNHQKFYDTNKDNPNAEFLFVRNGKDVGAGQEIGGIPRESLEHDRHELARFALDQLHKSDSPDHIKRGGSMGVNIWGYPPPPKPEEPAVAPPLQPRSQTAINAARKLLTKVPNAPPSQQSGRKPPPERRKFPIAKADGDDEEENDES